MILPLPPSHHSKDKAAKRRWREEMRRLLALLPCPRDGLLALSLDFYGPWLKNGKPDPKMPDLKNLLWDLEDEIARAVKRNDRCNFRIVLTKHNSTRSFCEVSLAPWRAT